MRKDAKLDGYVEVPRDHVIDLCMRKDQRLRISYEAMRTRKVEDLIRWNSGRRVWYAPWRFRPDMTVERAQEILDTPDEYGFTPLYVYNEMKRESEERLRIIKRTAELSGAETLLLSLRTYGWLKGIGDEDA